MKHLFAALFLITLCADCAKTNLHQHAVVCDYLVLEVSRNWLVVSNDAGSILKIFELPPHSGQLVETFDYESKNESDTYNLHLVTKVENGYSYVQSCYGVKNGLPVSFYAQWYTPDSFYTRVVHRIFVSGLDNMDAVLVPGGDGYEAYNSSTHTLGMVEFPFIQADLAIRIRTAPAAPFHSLYLPTAGQPTDSIFLNWTDFLPDDQFLPVETPGNGQFDYLEVSAVNPDFKRFITLLHYDTNYQPTTAVRNRVALPPNLDAQSHFRVVMQQGDFFTEKIFQPGEALRLEGPEISVNAAHFSNFHSLQIATSGNPDMVVVRCQFKAPILPQAYFASWNIQGPPESFEKMILPDLTELIPDLASAGLSHVSWEVSAYLYDRLDYSQLLDGFPYKGDGRVFPTARYGLQKVTKNY